MRYRLCRRKEEDGARAKACAQHGEPGKRSMKPFVCFYLFATFHLKIIFGKEAILGPLFKLFEAILELLIPLVVSNIINEGIKNDRGTGYIFKMVAIMIVLGLIGLLCSITAQ